MLQDFLPGEAGGEFLSQARVAATFVKAGRDWILAFGRAPVPAASTYRKISSTWDRCDGSSIELGPRL